ncbi:type IV toxin-antitoxin system AbiEi family antitoxin domain-containing protein [Actinoplanes sp. DH11]|uniref:type IV toxin-antitoxin system AbiEi family antitoxin domain-containing protein n=1 Tax=Actinoplanes sp. DH11 TaxID=2857011 RepID=UPI001E6199B9|nr:type IV toxin-antitoxin system AbiEi family antitoxin domain-containing protein [Actinoplanes sp. DH11]
MAATLEDIKRRQRGVITTTQTREAGLSADTTRNLHRPGRWPRLYRGVYATFTGEVPRPAMRWAAVLSAGAGAALSHRSAAEELGLVEEEAGAIHLLVQ